MPVLIVPTRPKIITPPGSFQPNVQKGPYTEGATQSWLKGSLVVTTGTGASVTLIIAPDNSTVLCGLAPQAAVGTGSLVPPNVLFRDKHYPFDLRGVILEMTISGSAQDGSTIGSPNGVTWAGGGTGGVALAPGQQYGMNLQTSGTYDKYQFVDVTNTTQKLFEIIQLAPPSSNGGVVQATTDYNPRVWVKVIDSVLAG